MTSIWSASLVGVSGVNECSISSIATLVACAITGSWKCKIIFSVKLVLLNAFIVDTGHIPSRWIVTSITCLVSLIVRSEQRWSEERNCLGFYCQDDRLGPFATFRSQQEPGADYKGMPGETVARTCPSCPLHTRLGICWTAKIDLA